MNTSTLARIVTATALVGAFAFGVPKSSAFGAQEPFAFGAQKKEAPPPKLTPFVGRFAALKERAKERHVGAIVHVLLEGEEETTRYVTEVFTNPELCKKSQELLVFIANNGTHPRSTIEETVDGKKVTREVCSLLTMFESCGQHQLAWDDLYAELQDDEGAMVCPQAVLLDPSGEIAARSEPGHAPDLDAVMAAIAALQKKHGPGLSDAQLERVLRLRSDGRASMKQAEWPVAWKAWTEISTIAVLTPYAEEAAKETPKAAEAMGKELERLLATVVPGHVAKTHPVLAEYVKSLAGTPLEKEANAKLKKLEGDKSIKAALAALRLEQEADRLLDEVHDLERANETKKADKALRKLLGKRYASTAAQQTARKLWPDVADEEDAKIPPAK